jgi:hypothetical protein
VAGTVSGPAGQDDGLTANGSTVVAGSPKSVPGAITAPAGMSLASGSAPGATTTGAASVAGGSAAAAPVTSGQPAATSAHGPVGTALGVTDKTIKVGVYTVEGFSSVASSFGFNVATGDQAADAKAVIKYLNAHGGMAGRTIEPVIHDANVAELSNNPSSEYEAACAAWTKDTRVYAVVSPVGTVNNTLYDCLSKAGVPTVSAGESQDASFFQKYGDYYYYPTDMNLRRILSNNVDALASAGFFGVHAKIGLILGDTANERAAVDDGLKPALARHGLSLADSFAVQADSSGAATYDNAVLRFKAEGITHVIFTYIGSPLEFMLSAKSQHYHPAYALNSRNSPAAELEGNAPSDQQQGSMGIGWQPMNDVDTSHDPGIFSDRQKLCLKLIKDAGQNTSVRATALVGLWMCDNLFFLRDALLRAPTFAIAGLRAGAETLTHYDAASTFRSTFAPGRLHDGASAYRLFAYKSPCSCYEYISGLRPAA